MKIVIFNETSKLVNIIVFNSFCFVGVFVCNIFILATIMKIAMFRYLPIVDVCLGSYSNNIYIWKLTSSYVLYNDANLLRY